MSYCVEEGKDQIIFATKEDLDQPSKAIINFEEDEDDHQPGLILANGDINWDCPCLGGMASGPCGVEFREAFSCFHYSKAEPKGSDCYEAFVTMQTCMSQFPELYPPSKSEGEEAAQLSKIGDDAEKQELVTVMSSGEESMAQTASEKS